MASVVTSSVAAATSLPHGTDSVPSPPLYRWILGFLLVGLAWGFTTPFIRRAAIHFHPPRHDSVEKIDPFKSRTAWLRYRIVKAFWAVADLLRSPAYAVPLLLNVTGSVWFFLLIGQAGEYFHLHYCALGSGFLFPASRKGRGSVGRLKIRLLYQSLMTSLNFRRTEFDRTHHELSGLPLHSVRGMVCRGEEYQSRYVRRPSTSPERIYQGLLTTPVSFRFQIRG